jgi:hypothetical protein
VDLANQRGTATTCFLRIEGKTVTLKGSGAIIFGEGHDKPYLDPYQTRAGICVINGGVVLDGIRIKEFQKRCLVSYNSTVVAKNSIIEGCDEGGVSMLGNSKGLFVNNFFVATGAVLMWQNSYAKLVNNTIYASNIQYFFHPNSNDSAKVEAINNIIVNEENTIGQVGWWPTEVDKMNNSVFSNNLIWKNSKPCYPPLEYCADFPGKIVADPMFIEPVIDQRGMAAWANFGFKDGSPAVGKGDASIPGTKNLGQSGGPCSEPASSVCSSFISANTPNSNNPTPTTIPNASNTPTPTNNPNVTASPTPTGPTPTGTIVYSPTPTSPSSTPNPTNTPGPTSTPKPTSTPRPTSTPTVTPYPQTGPPKLPKIPPEPYPKSPVCPLENLCTTKKSGDTNCDKVTNEADFIGWKLQFDTIPVIQANQSANFLCVEDNSSTYFVDLTDFEVWRRFTTDGLKK